MKNLLKTVMFAAVGTVLFASCNKKDDFDWEAEKARVLKEEEAMVELLSQQKTKIEEYVDANFESPIEDTTTIRFNVLDRKDVKRGIWYEVLSPATDDTYEYKLNQNGQNLVILYPKVKIDYNVQLLNGNNTPVESQVNSDFNLSQNFPVRNSVWDFSFLPSKMKYNGIEYQIGGLTEKGLKKGSKIRVVAPSIFAYGSKGNGKSGEEGIPANSPLVYEFTVLGIE